MSEQPDPTNIDDLSYEQLADRLGEVEGVHYDEDRAVMARVADILRVVGVLGPNADGLADFIIDTRQQIAQANKARDAALAQVEEFKRREHARFVGALSVPPEVFVDLNAIPRLYATGDIVIKTAAGWVHVIRAEPGRADGPLRANPTPDMTTDIAIRYDGYPGDGTEILGRLGRPFTVAYQGRAITCPDNTWTQL